MLTKKGKLPCWRIIDIVYKLLVLIGVVNRMMNNTKKNKKFEIYKHREHCNRHIIKTVMNTCRGFGV